MSVHEHESDVDPFLCTCGPCKKFWKDNFSEAADLLRQSSLSRATDTALVGPKNSVVKVGDRVVVHGKHPGTVKFVGVVDDNAIAPQLYVGVKLDDNVNSTHNGIYKGKRYFHCTPGHGAMVRYTEVRPIKTLQKTPPLQNNYMFPSWDEVKKRRKERNEKLVALYDKAGISPPSSVMSMPSITPTRRTPVPEPIVNVSDPNDMALRIQERRKELEKKRLLATVENKEKKEMWQLKQQFGGGNEGERLARTLMKLKNAYNEGLNLATRKSLQYDLDYYDDDN